MTDERKGNCKIGRRACQSCWFMCVADVARRLRAGHDEVETKREEISQNDLLRTRVAFSRAG